MLRPARLWLSAGVLAATGYAGARSLGPIPALGPLLDPANGVWGVAGTAELPPREEVTLAGLDGEVRVVFDDRRVPHIYASSVPDAYYG